MIKNIFLIATFGIFFVVLVLLITNPQPTPQIEAGTVKQQDPDLPNPLFTPGAINKDITQANIKDNICNPHWTTKSIRPTSSYTTKLKIAQMKQSHLQGQTADYEEDHLISLEGGGNPTDPKNLWPEHYSEPYGAKDKDKVENTIHSQVCRGIITLQQGQDILAHHWKEFFIKNYQNGKATN